VLKVDSIVAPKKIVASQIIRYVRAKMTKDHDSAVKTLYKIVDGEVEAVEFKVTEHFNYLPNVAVKLPALAVEI
jgi:trk system potassium uptake protein TrkA